MMLTFSEWTKATGNQLQITESLSRKGWVKVAALALTTRAHQHRSSVRNATNINMKVDALADLMTTVAHLQTLSIATDLNDRTLLKGRTRK
jgi:hypothetical protein